MALAPEYDAIWAKSGDVYNLADAVQDLVVQDLALAMQAHISDLKAGAPVPPSLDVGLPVISIGNGYQIIDARNFVPMAGAYPSRDRSRIQRLSVHHSVTREPKTATDELALLTEIGNYHISGNGWPGFAYHFAVAPSGRPYYCGDLATTRYTVGNDNPNNAAICMLGTFSDWVPAPPAMETLRLLIGEVQFELGWMVPYMAHGDTPGTSPTECCGTALRAVLPELAG